MASVPDSLKREIRSVLLSKVGGVRLADFQRDFKQLTCHKIDFNSLGFSSITDLLESIPDVAKVVRSQDNTYRIFGNPSEGMFMNTTAKKAQYKDGKHQDTKQFKPGRVQSKESYKVDPSEIQPNLSGLYALCFLKQPGLTREDVHKEFSQFGKLAESTMAERYVFVRYGSHAEAKAALEALGDKYQICIPRERSVARQIIKEKDIKGNMPDPPKPREPNADSLLAKEDTQTVDVYIGNLPSQTTDVEIQRLISDYHVINVRSKYSDNKRFVFVSVEPNVAQQMVADLNHTKFNGNKIIVETCYSKISAANPKNIESELSNMTNKNLPPRNQGSSDRGQHQKVQGQRGGHASRGHFQNHGNAGSRNEQVHTQQTGYLQYDEDMPALDELVAEDAVVSSLAAVNLHASEDAYSDAYEDCSVRSNVSDNVSSIGEAGVGKYDPDTFDLYVGNFPFGTRHVDLYNLVKPYGAVRLDILNNQPPIKPYAFVKFYEYDLAENAMVCLDGSYFGERPLIVNFARNTFAPDDIVKDRLKQIKCTVSLSDGNNPGRHVIFDRGDSNISQPQKSLQGMTHGGGRGSGALHGSGDTPQFSQSYNYPFESGYPSNDEDSGYGYSRGSGGQVFNKVGYDQSFHQRGGYGRGSHVARGRGSNVSGYHDRGGYEGGFGGRVGYDGGYGGRGGYDGGYGGRGGYDGGYGGRGGYEGGYIVRGGHDDGGYIGRGGHDGGYIGRGGHDGGYRGRGGHDGGFSGRGHDGGYRGRGGHDGVYRGRGGHDGGYSGRGAYVSGYGSDSGSEGRGSRRGGGRGRGANSTSRLSGSVGQDHGVGSDTNSDKTITNSVHSSETELRENVKDSHSLKVNNNPQIKDSLTESRDPKEHKPSVAEKILSSVRSQAPVTEDTSLQDDSQSEQLTQETASAPEVNTSSSQPPSHKVEDNFDMPPLEGEEKEDTAVSPELLQTTSSEEAQVNGVTESRVTRSSGTPDAGTSLPDMMTENILDKMYKEAFPNVPKPGNRKGQIKVIPTHVEPDSKHHMWGLVVPDEDPDVSYSELQEAVTQLVQGRDPRADLCRGAVLAEGEFCRCWVVDAPDEEKVKIFFVDWGNTDVVSKNSLLFLENEIWDVPPFASPFYLPDGVEGTGVTENVMQRHSATCLDQVSQGHVTAISSISLTQ